MTPLPDWLVERAALGEVPAVSRDRIDRADPDELAERIAALRADSDAELARHPAAAAVALIEGRIAANRRAVARDRRRLWLGMLGTAAVAGALVVVLARRGPDAGVSPPHEEAEITRVKGSARLLAFRQVGDDAERLEQDALVRAGDRLQLRYHAGGQGYGVIASIDGAGAVTLHFPASEDAPAEATALAPKLTTLPDAYALDDAPHFERFFFITSAAPLDVQHSLAAVRALAARGDGATAALELPSGLHQWSLRLRKPQRQEDRHD